jgi:hypothetical protein
VECSGEQGEKNSHSFICGDGAKPHTTCISILKVPNQAINCPPILTEYLLKDIEDQVCIFEFLDFWE